MNNTYLKYKLLFVFLFALITISLQSQTTVINTTSGSFYISSSQYLNNMNRSWKIDTGENSPLLISFEVDIELDYDFIYIYALDAADSATLVKTVTGADAGVCSTVIPTGKALVAFHTDGSICGSSGYYQGFVIYFKLDTQQDDTHIINHLHVNDQATVINNLSVGRLNTGEGAVSIYNYKKQQPGMRVYSYDRWSGNVYGLYSQAVNNGTGRVYGIYSSVSGTSNLKWAGFFTGGDVTVLNGNVGIGTSTPSQNLSVTGRFTIAPSGTSPDNGYTGNIVITKPAAGGQYINLIRQNQYPWSIGMVYNSNKFAIGKGESNDANFINPYFVIDTNGKVGVGTTQIPDSFKLAVAGKILAEEVVVELQENWPDYVFKTGYELMPLHQVEKFVHTNQHLPGIPSASRVKDKGLSIGEMQHLLLQKIEELTLYIIEQDKKIKSLEEQLK